MLLRKGAGEEVCDARHVLPSSASSDPRVESAIGEIGEQVDDEVGEYHPDDSRLDNGVVAAVDRRHEETADAGAAEECLDDDHAAEQRADGDGGQCDDDAHDIFQDISK